MNSRDDNVHAPVEPYALRSLPVAKATLPAQIHSFLEEAIIRGEIAPSTRLHADDIAAHYGVSRIPVREALRSLHEAGWVDIRPRYGVYVRERSIVEVRELFEARAGIESQIAGLAAAHRTDDELAELRRVVASGRLAAQDGDMIAAAELGIQFNKILRDACRNGVLAAISASLEKRARFYFGMIERRLGADWVSVEMKMVELIAAGDVLGVTEVAHDHIRDTGIEVLNLLTDQP